MNWSQQSKGPRRPRLPIKHSLTGSAEQKSEGDLRIISKGDLSAPPHVWGVSREQTYSIAGGGVAQLSSGAFPGKSQMWLVPRGQ